MTRDQIIIMGSVVVVFVAYPIAMGILANAVHPSRLKMAQLGKELLASPKLDELRKHIIDEWLDDAFDWRFMLGMSIALPILILCFIFGFRPKVMTIDDAETRQKFLLFSSYHTRATAAANPLFALIVALELGLLVMVLFPLGLMRRLGDVIVEASLNAERMIHSLWFHA